MNASLQSAVTAGNVHYISAVRTAMGCFARVVEAQAYPTTIPF